MRTDTQMNCIDVELQTRGVLAFVFTILALKVALIISLVGVAQCVTVQKFLSPKGLVTMLTGKL